MTDIKLLKQEIKAEVLAELQANSRTQIPAVEAIRKKWFNGSNPHNKYSGSKTEKLFGSKGQHRVWEAMRSLTRLIFDKENQAQLRYVDQNELEQVMDALCEVIFSLREQEYKNKDVLPRRIQMNRQYSVVRESCKDDFTFLDKIYIVERHLCKRLILGSDWNMRGIAICLDDILDETSLKRVKDVLKQELANAKNVAIHNGSISTTIMPIEELLKDEKGV